MASVEQSKKFEFAKEEDIMQGLVDSRLFKPTAEE